MGQFLCDQRLGLRCPESSPFADPFQYRRTLRADAKSITNALVMVVSMGLVRRDCPHPVLVNASPTTDLDVISFLRALADARLRLAVRIPAWSLLLVAVLGISRCQSLRT
jgi:hypothetical protein